MVDFTRLGEDKAVVTRNNGMLDQENPINRNRNCSEDSMIIDHAVHRFRDALLVMALLGLTLIPQSASATTITFTNMQAVFSTTVDPLTGIQTVSLLVDSTLFGDGGFADGQVQFEDVVGGIPPDDGLWSIFGGNPPEDNMPAISFDFNLAGELVAAGPPDDSRVLAGITNGVFTPLWELDFSDVTGSLGSIFLAGLLAHELNEDGSLKMVNGMTVTHNVASFTINAVPVPAAIWLFGTAIIGLLGIGRRRKAA